MNTWIAQLMDVCIYNNRGYFFNVMRYINLRFTFYLLPHQSIFVPVYLHPKFSRNFAAKQLYVTVILQF